MAAGLRFLPKPWRFLHQLNTEFSRLPRTAIPACRLSSTTSKTLPGEEAQAENWRRRVDLAASYRILEKYNLHEGVCNHLSMMAPAANGDGEVMLVIPYGLHWSEVSNLLLSFMNEESTSLHSCLWHTVLKEIYDTRIPGVPL